MWRFAELLGIDPLGSLGFLVNLFTVSGIVDGKWTQIVASGAEANIGAELAKFEVSQ